MDAVARRRWPRLAGLAAVLVGGALLAHRAGLGDLVSLEGVAQFKQWIEGFGPWAPVVFVAGYVVAVLFFFPALPLTLLAGLAFGPIWGTAYASVASLVGAALSFLVARYALRGVVEGWMARSPGLARLDAGVAEHGWRILMVTRLVPIFPFNLQNFAYGLTRLRFWTFVGLSWLFMLPGTAAYTLAAGALAEGGRDPRRTLAYLAVAAVLIVALSLLPRWLERRSRAAGAVLGSR